MATSLEISFPAAQSPDTALALVLPKTHLDIVQPFRSMYDAAAIKWPPHINLFYPFVHAEVIESASEYLAEQLPSICNTPLTVRFGKVEIFNGGKKRPSFIVLRPDEETEERLQEIYELLAREFPEVAKSVKKQFKPHLTIGQIHKGTEARIRSFEKKANMLCNLIGSVGMGISTMRRIDGKMTYVRSWGVEEYTASLSAESIPKSIIKRDTWMTRRIRDNEEEALDDECSEDNPWVATDPTLEVERIPGRRFTISSYNVYFDMDDTENAESRWWGLCKKIIACKSTIVCLQEVSDDLLGMLGEVPDVRKKYPYFSHSPEQPLLRHQNCVILSSVPFTWEEVSSAHQYRSIGFAKFDSFGSYSIIPNEDEANKEEPKKVWNSLIVSNAHLPAYLTDESIKVKAAYTKELKAHLEQHYPENAVLIVGDTNIHADETIEYAMKGKIILESSAEQIKALFPASEYHDAWLVAGEGFDGSTYDPISNPLAGNSSKGGSDVPVIAQRYDRMYLRKQGGDNLLIRELSVTRDTEKPTSDHFMLNAKFAFIDSERTDTAAMFELPGTSLADSDLRNLLVDNNCFPSEEDTELRHRAIQSLEACLKGFDGLTPTKSDETFQLRLVPVGSFGLGTYDASSDIDCLVVGTISTNLFWKVAKQRIKRWRGLPATETSGLTTPLSVKIVRYVDAAIPMLILLVGDSIRIDLQYCTAVRIVEAWDSIPTLPMNHQLFNLTVPTLKKLQAYRDMLFILNRVPNLATFRLAYRFIKLWASNKGIYSSKFGFFGGVHITLLLVRISMLLPPHATASQLLVTFFKQYSSQKWASETVTVPNTGRTLRYQRAARDKMVILTINTPAVNVAANATLHTVNTIASELEQASAKFEFEASYAEVIGSIGDDNTSIKSSVADFLTGFNRYVKIDVQFWGSSRQNGRALVGWVESRLVMLLAELSKQTPNLNARIWPHRFHEVKAENQAAEVSEDDRSELRGFYLIGLAPSSSSGEMSKEEKKNGEATFLNVLQDFESRVRNPDKFDEKDSWIHVACVKPAEFTSEAGNIVEEDRTMVWDGGEADEEGDTIPDEDSSEEEEEIAGNLLEKDPANSFDDFFGSLRKDGTGGKKSKSAASPSQQQQSGQTPKLRPSHEVFNRIKWDSRYDASGYVVGYEDRFRGVMEIGLDKWKTEMSDEEFIPMHRVVYFKEKKSGEIVWDREKRIDRVFGSGKKEKDQKKKNGN